MAFVCIHKVLKASVFGFDGSNEKQIHSGLRAFEGTSEPVWSSNCDHINESLEVDCTPMGFEFPQCVFICICVFVDVESGKLEVQCSDELAKPSYPHILYSACV